MKAGLTKIVMVLDRSYSMTYIREATISGVNEFLGGQKATDGDATLTLAQFDDRYEVVYNNVNIKDVRELTDETFVPRGNTALYDAIGQTIETVGKELHDLRESERPEKVVFVIITDGEENCSRMFTHEKVTAMIEHQKTTYNWEFVFLAANQDAMAVGSSFSIPAANSMTYGANAVAVQNVFSNMSRKLSTVRTEKGASMAYTPEEREEQEKLN